MRLTKQLKAQANSLRFASQIPTKTTYIPNHDPSSSDGQSKSIVSNDHEENSFPLATKPNVTFKTVPNNCDNKEKMKNSNYYHDKSIRKLFKL
jgi:hypothetical protein